MNRATLSDVVLHLWESFLIVLNKFVKSSFPNIERVEVGQKVIADEEAEKHKVIDDTLQVKLYLHLLSYRPVLKHHVLSEETDVYELVVWRFRQLQSLDSAVLLFLNNMLFSYDSEMGLVSEQREHDEVSVSAVEAVSRIGIVSIFQP